MSLRPASTNHSRAWWLQAWRTNRGSGLRCRCTTDFVGANGIAVGPGDPRTQFGPLWRGTEREAHERIFAGQDYEGLDRLVMVRTPEWKLTRYDESGGELYNLLDDPDELYNRIDDPKYSAVATRLSKNLEEWIGNILMPNRKSRRKWKRRTRKLSVGSGRRSQAGPRKPGSGGQLTIAGSRLMY